MQVQGKIALVSGANRGLGKAFVDQLLAAGAAKVYAAMRTPVNSDLARVVDIRLDITSNAQVAAAARECADIDILINNAGVIGWSPALAANSDSALRQEFEVNVMGTLAMMRAFSPGLARRGGGAIVNMLSVVSWYTSAFNATYCASKQALQALTDGARIELKKHGTLVVGVYAGFIDTDMTAGINQQKVSPALVAQQALQGLQADQEQVLADQRAQTVWQRMRADPAQLAAEMQQAWDRAQSSP